MRHNNLFILPLLLMADGTAGGATDIALDADVATIVPGTIQRSDKPVCPDPDKKVFSLIKGEPYKKMEQLLAGHLKSMNEEPYLDNRALARGVKRKLVSLLVKDPSAKIFEGTEYQSKLPETLKDMTVAEFIKRQFAHATAIAKSLWLAEFFNYNVPTPNGYGRARTFAYNNAGFVICEWRGYININATSAGPSNAVARKSASDELISTEQIDLEPVESPEQKTGKLDTKKAL